MRSRKFRRPEENYRAASARAVDPKLPLMPLNYSKWDNLDDSDDDDAPPANKGGSGGGGSSGAVSKAKSTDERQSASVTSSFVLRTIRSSNRVPVYINVCASHVVPGGAMTATPTAANNLLATNLPYIVGDVRQDNDGEEACHVVECIFHPDTIKRADADKLAAETVIQTALAVVSQRQFELEQREWSVVTHDALKDSSTTYFFAPGRLANVDLSAVE